MEQEDNYAKGYLGAGQPSVPDDRQEEFWELLAEIRLRQDYSR